jgi:hypothetical protein
VDKIYNSPPNWPPPPEGWMPEPGWKPDAHWGPAPPGWKFWVDPASEPLVAGPSMPSDAAADELRVFLSYRRTDCQAQANGLYDGLRNRLPDARVFMDIDGIPFGVDFVDQIGREMAMCDVVLVMIGDNWLDARPGADVRRLDEPEDFVRLEIESALASSAVRTLPVLVENAQMPRSSELPASIARLARINAIELNDLRWRADLDRLVDVVESIGREKGKVATHAPDPAPVTRPAPEKAPVLLADPGHAGKEPQGTIGPSRTPPIAYLLMVVPFLTFGFAAWVPALWAGLKRPAGSRARKELFILSGALFAAVVVAILFIDAAPEDSAGESSGPLLAIGSILWILTVVIGTVVAVALRKPPAAERPRGVQ